VYLETIVHQVLPLAPDELSPLSTPGTCITHAGTARLALIGGHELSRYGTRYHQLGLVLDALLHGGDNGLQTDAVAMHS